MLSIGVALWVPNVFIDREGEVKIIKKGEKRKNFLPL